MAMYVFRYFHAGGIQEIIINIFLLDHALFMPKATM